MSRKPKYTYERSGCQWIIREWKYTEHGGGGTKIDVKYSLEEARNEVYRLNGWKEAPSKPPPGGMENNFPKVFIRLVKLWESYQKRDIGKLGMALPRKQVQIGMTENDTLNGRCTQTLNGGYWSLKKREHG